MVSPCPFERRSILLVASALAWLVLVVFARDSLAGGFHNAEFGVRRMGMMAVVGRPDDGSAMFHNPAGLVLTRGNQFYHSQAWFLVEMATRMYDSQGVLRPDHPIEPEWSLGVIPFLGFVSDLGTERLRLGVAVYAPNAYGAALPEDEPTRYHAIDALFVGSRATASAAYQVSERFSVGGSINLVHVYLTASRLMNPLVLQDPDRRFDDPSATAPLDARLELDGQDFAWGVDLGLLFHPTDRFRIGAAFSGGSAVDLSGEVTLRYPDGTVEQTVHHTRMVIPFTLRGGFNWEFAPDFEFGADIYYYHYQIFQEQRTELEDPIMGMTRFVDPKNYTNSFTLSFGLLHRITPTLEFMVGFQRDFSPIPERTYALDNPSRDHRGISAGVRWQALENHRFGLAMERLWFDLVDVQTSVSTPPTNVKGHGENLAFGLDYAFSF